MERAEGGHEMMKKYAKVLIALAMALILAVEILPGVIRGASAADDAGAFAELCYKEILGRTPGESEKAAWVSELESGQAGGAQVISGIIESDEFTAKRYPTEVIVRMMYQFMLDREPDESGLKNWIAVIDGGRPLSVMVTGMAKTDVFKAKCDKYGILSGIVTPEKKKKDRGYDIIDPKTNRKYILGFLTRCYQALLGREPEQDGLDEWTKRLMSGRVTGAQTVREFVDSFEFIKRNLSKEDTVEALYLCMLGRKADATGKAEWVAKLQDGVTLNQVIGEISGSDEFTAMCNECGIKTGAVPGGEKETTGGGGGEPAVEPDPDKIATYVARCYRGLLGRKGSSTEIDEWTYKYCKGLTGTLGIMSMISSREFVNRKLKNKQVIEVLYRAMLGRSADETGMEQMAALLSDGYSVEKVINLIAGSQEYQAVCQDIGIKSGIVGEKPQVTKAPVTPNPSQYKNPEKNTAFVQHLYATILKRPGDEASIKKMVDSITNGTRTPEQTIMSFLTSDEFMSKVRVLPGIDVIKIMYRAYLYRDASEEEVAYWLEFVPGAIGDVEKAAVTFEKSKEFNDILDAMKE